MDSPISIKLWFKEVDEGSVFDHEIRGIRPKERAERIRTLATLAIIVRPISNILANADTSSIKITTELSSGNRLHTASDTSKFSVNVSLSYFSHPELYEDIINTPSGHVTARLRALAESGLLIQKFASSIDNNRVKHRQTVFQEEDHDTEVPKTTHHQKPTPKKTSTTKKTAPAVDRVEDVEPPHHQPSGELEANVDTENDTPNEDTSHDNQPIKSSTDMPEGSNSDTQDQEQSSSQNVTDKDKGGSRSTPKRSSRMKRISM